MLEVCASGKGIGVLATYWHVHLRRVEACCKRNWLLGKVQVSYQYIDLFYWERAMRIVNQLASASEKCWDIQGAHGLLGKVEECCQLPIIIYTTIGDACVCVCAKFDQFLPVCPHFDTKRPVNFFHIATFPSPTFGPLFAFHCPLFFTKNNNLHAAMFWKVTVTTQDRPLNRKHPMPLTRVVHW